MTATAQRHAVLVPRRRACDGPPARTGAWQLGEVTSLRLEAGAVATAAAVRGVDLLAPARRALAALDLGDRVALGPAVIGDDAVSGGLVLGLVWRIDRLGPAARIGPEAFEAFDRPGHVKLRWEIVTTVSEDAARLSIATRWTPTDVLARTGLLDAWAIVAPMSAALVRRAARQIGARAEQDG